MNRAVFLDRDGVISRAEVRDGRPYAPLSLERFELLPRVPEAVTRLKAAGFRVIVVTNQPDVAHGRVARQVVEDMHALLRRCVDVDDIRVCYHADDDRCLCRKPRPAMLVTAAADYALDLGRSFMVGDRWRDIEAGRAAGCRTILVDHGYTEGVRTDPDLVVHSLWEATEHIANSRPEEQSSRKDRSA